MPELSPFNSQLLLGIHCTSSVLASQAERLATALQQPLLKTPPHTIDNGSFVLLVSETGVSLQATGKKVAGPIMVDFTAGATAHRRQFGGGKGQMIAKAIGIKNAFRPHVLDVTAGLGQDAFVLATLGCRMSLVERSPIVHALLDDGLKRAQLVADESLLSVVSRIELAHDNSIEYIKALSEPVDVIYLDPMFPERNNKAQVNKNMQAFHSLVGEDNDAGNLLQQALQKVIYRVVVKRPRKAPSIDQQFPELALPKPNIVFEGKSTRYDVYTLKKMP